jgi:hypothetical protein
MRTIALVPWVVLGILLAALAPTVRSAIVGWLLVLAGSAVFAVRLHHAGPYPFPGAMDLASGCAALTWQHFRDRPDLEEFAIALRFVPCPEPLSPTRP